MEKQEARIVAASVDPEQRKRAKTEKLEAENPDKQSKPKMSAAKPKMSADKPRKEAEISEQGIKDVEALLDHEPTPEELDRYEPTPEELERYYRPDRIKLNDITAPGTRAARHAEYWE